MKSGFETKAGNEARDGKAPFVPPSVEQMAKLFPQLEVIELLGQGGIGAVYKVRQPRLNRCVALKILSPEKQRDPRFAERFEREARALAWLDHPNIVTVLDYGFDAFAFYFSFYQQKRSYFSFGSAHVGFADFAFTVYNEHFVACFEFG